MRQEQENEIAQDIGKAIKKKRRQLGVTLQELSQNSGFSTGYLSKIENAKGMPPFSTLHTIATTLGLDCLDLLDQEVRQAEGPAAHASDITIVKYLPEPALDGISDGYLQYPLTTKYKNRNMSPFLVYIKPGETKCFKHDAEEFNYIVKGPVLFKYDQELYTFENGDGFYFDSRVEHTFINQNDYVASLLSMVMVYRKF